MSIFAALEGAELRVSRMVRLSAALLCVSVAACASAPAPFQPRTAVHTEPAPSVVPQGTLEAPAPAPLPNVAPSAGSNLASPTEQRIAAIDAPAGSNVGDVVRQIGQKLGLNVVVDPDVRTTVEAHLHDVTLNQALDELVRKNNLAYQIEDHTLRITPLRFHTKIFTLDYVALSRVGTANTVIQRRLSSTTNTGTQTIGSVSGLSSAAAGAPGSDVISAVQVSDLWTELRVSLVGLLGKSSVGNGAPGSSALGSATGQGVTPNPQSLPGGSGTGGATLGGAFSQSWSDGTSLTLSPSSGLITVTASDQELAEVQTYIDAFQSSVLRQVLIEAKIVEVQLSRSLQYGIDWNVVTPSGKGTLTVGSGTPIASSTAGSSSGSGSGSSGTATTPASPTGNITFTIPSGNTQINAVLTALRSQGDVRVLSDARTTALNNQRAVFDVTTDEVFFAETRQPLLGPTGGVVGFNDQVTPQQISVGIVLDVLPQISRDNTLTMNIRPVVTSLNRVETFTAGDGTTARFPVTDRREGDTMARVRNGETIVIGGLMQTQHTLNHSGIPILMDIPLIGKLFQHVDDEENKVELVVFLTPTVIAGQPDARK